MLTLLAPITVSALITTKERTAKKVGCRFKPFTMILVTAVFSIRPVKLPLAEKGEETIQKGVNLGRLLSDLQTLTF